MDKLTALEQGSLYILREALLTIREAIAGGEGV